MRFHPRDGGELSDAQADVVRTILGGPRGALIDASGDLAAVPLGPFEPLLIDPELAMRVQSLGERVRFRASLSAVQRELAILLVARHWRCGYEWHTHHPLALQAGLAEDLADDVRRGVTERLDGELRPVAGFVGELLATGHVDDPTFRDVADRWGEHGALDLVAIVGYYTLLAFVLNVDARTDDEVGDPFPDAAAP